MKRTVVILNPVSGSSGAEYRALVESELKSHGIEFELRETDPEKGGEELTQNAIKKGAKHLIACGGDGTVMSVISGISKQENTGRNRDVLLSIIPGGTANLLAGALQIPSDTKKAVAVTVSGKERVIDLGRCGQHTFALGLGLGVTERLVSQTSAEEKEKIGKLAYAKAMLAELGTRPSTFTFQLDQNPKQRARGVAIVIANAGQIGGGFSFAPAAEMDDGVLDLCILHRFYLRDVVRMIWRSLWGNLPADRAVSFFQARHIEISSEPPLDLQIDGELMDSTTPLVTQILPRALRVRVPAEDEDTEVKTQISN